MAVEVVMPKLGLTMEEGTIVNWLKQEGDRVSKGEMILEIETDKSTVEVESPASGILGSLLFPIGSTLPVGKVITHILASEERSVMPEPVIHSAGIREARIAEKPVSVSTRASLQPDRITASPVARRLARELGVDLSQVFGKGPNGRVMEEDVRRAAQEALPALAELPVLAAAPGEIHPLGNIRKLTAERMVQSFTSAPHFYLSVETDASLLLRMREGCIAPIEAKTGIRPTISDFLIKIAAQALIEHPEVNVCWDQGGVRNLPDVNVGLAVATERGLLVPVFHQADRETLAKIASSRQALVDKARKAALTLRDLEGGSFTISNLGTFAVDQFNAIINPPQSAILAVGRIKDRPVAVKGELAIRPTMVITLSIDHRVLDGAQAALFLDRLVHLIEEPYLITTLW